MVDDAVSIDSVHQSVPDVDSETQSVAPLDAEAESKQFQAAPNDVDFRDDEDDGFDDDEDGDDGWGDDVELVFDDQKQIDIEHREEEDCQAILERALESRRRAQSKLEAFWKCGKCQFLLSEDCCFHFSRIETSARFLEC